MQTYMLHKESNLPQNVTNRGRFFAELMGLIDPVGGIKHPSPYHRCHRGILTLSVLQNMPSAQIGTFTYCLTV